MLFRSNQFFPKIKKEDFFRSVHAEKAFRCAPPNSGHICRRASLTVECAFVLPLFFLASVTLILFMNAVGLQVKTGIELSNTARQTAAYAGAAGEALDAAGDGEAVWIDLPRVATYSFPVSLIPGLSVRVAAEAHVYPFVGIRDWSGTSYGAGDGSGGMVYVTDNREVYHTHADCTHLDLTIIAVPFSSVSDLRSEDGRRYKPCAGFPAGYTGTVYVTARGEYYYPSTAYGSLTRHVHLVREPEAAGLPLCERCARRDAGHVHAAA